MQQLLTLLLFLLFSNAIYVKHTPLIPQPTACITSSFSNTGSPFWKTITLPLSKQDAHNPETLCA